VSKIALLFPGQGAQSVGMGAGIVSRCEAAKHLFEQASGVLGYDLLDLCVQGPADKLNLTSYSQPALFVHSAAALMELRLKGNEGGDSNPVDTAVAVAGLSLGEYSALYAAGAIAFEDGVKLVAERGAAMQDAASSQPSGMASVLGLELEQVQKLCDDARQDGEILQIANLLCPGNTAISGHQKSIEAAEAIAISMGAMKYIRLPVAGAFHTNIMTPAVSRLKAAISVCPMNNAKVPLYANVDAASHTQASEFRELLPQQVVSQVRWEDSLRAMLADGIEEFYEIGAGRVLAGTLKRIHRKAVCQSIGD
jgi:[acyl-carrier-protein] S-malonyltransferase